MIRKTLAGIAYLVLLILALPAIGACMAPIDGAAPPAAPPAALAPEPSPPPTAAIVEPPAALAPAPAPLPPTAWGWWAPWGEPVEISTAAIVGWLNTCPAYPGIVETLLADGARVWLPVESSGVGPEILPQLPFAGGVCEVL